MEQRRETHDEYKKIAGERQDSAVLLLKFMLYVRELFHLSHLSWRKPQTDLNLTKIFFSQFVRVTVDKCKGAPVMEGRRRRAVEDMSQCSSTARTRGDNNK